jgi:D-alanine-D-alanine ligase
MFSTARACALTRLYGWFRCFLENGSECADRSTDVLSCVGMTSSEPVLLAKLRVALLYGGRSTEHEISLRSAASVYSQLDRARYEVTPIYVDQRGAFHRQALALPGGPMPALPASVVPPVQPLAAREGRLLAADGDSAFDVVFPIMHGPLCEDGSIQGLLELADLPYVGARVLGSALGMDKDVAKRLVRAEGIPIVPYLTLRAPEYAADRSDVHARIAREIGFPTFVKPATLGSSVGVSRANDADELAAALDTAFRYDEKILVEKAVNAREIEYAVLAAADPTQAPEVSVPGEIRPREAFYSFERKYLDESGADLLVPAPLDAAHVAQGRDAARRIFLALECEGMARVDFLLDRDTDTFYFNEVNTIPGFTDISMYPKLWEASGLSYGKLLDRLVRDAMQRHARRARLSRQR